MCQPALIGRTIRVLLLTLVPGAPQAMADAPGIFEYERNAVNWMSAARCHEAYAFDRFYAGTTINSCLSGGTAPVTLTLASGTITISTSVSATPHCPIFDGSSGSTVSDVDIRHNGVATFEFEPPVTAFYIYYGSLAQGRVGTMRLYQGGVLMDTLISAPSPHDVLATGHGFTTAAAPIDRVEITMNDTTNAALGAFTGLAAGEPSLGTTTIQNYDGPGNSQTIPLDFGCTFVRTARVHNIQQNIWHDCIRDAIAFANNGDTLVAQASVYQEAIDFRGKGVTIVSADPNDPDVVEQTVISAGETDWSAVTAASSEGNGSMLVGLTITGGQGTLVSGDRRGGGLYAPNGSPTIDRCTFIANSAQQPNAFIGRGGAAYIGDTAQPSFVNCHFQGNGAYDGGAIHARSGGWTLQECTFIGNTASLRGGGLSVSVGTAAPGVIGVASCTFTSNEAGNQGGAIAVTNASGPAGGQFLSLDISDTAFHTNHASSGNSGGAIWSSGGLVEASNCDFVRNSAGGGGAIDLSGDEMGEAANEIRDCAFIENSATPGFGGGIVTVSSSGPGGMTANIHQCLFWRNTGVSVLGRSNESETNVTSCTFAGNGPDVTIHSEISPVRVENSILWDEPVPSVGTTMEGDVYLSYSTVRDPALGGDGVIHADPRFVDPAVGDFRLLADSPCINAGTGSYDPRNPQADYNGDPRHQGTIDLGIFESPLDCNANGLADHIEIAQNLVTDCNQNLRADDCETDLDANCNGTLDLCEIASGVLHDTNANGVADELEVGGVLAGVHTWSVTNGGCTRLLTQDLTISGTLTIEAGVNVRILDGVKIRVLNAGKLFINGSAGEPVVFASTHVAPEAGDWGGILYSAGSMGAVTHAHISHVLNHGVRIESAAVSVTDSLITDVAGLDRPMGVSGSPAQVGGPAYGIYVSGNVSPTFARNVIERVRGGAGGRGGFATGGNDGASGAHASAWGGDGGNGGNATTNGSTGVPGAAGGDAFGIFCGTSTNATLVNNRIHAIFGGPGGSGGNGGSGGWGGDGGSGRQANVTVFPPVCSGGDGGNGGNGSHGGSGGNGGNGATACAIQFTAAAGGIIRQNLIGDVLGGSGGRGGSGGLGGNGGSGGNGATGNQGLVCGDGPGAGGDGGDGGNGGNGGSGGHGGTAYGINVGTSSLSVVGAEQNTIAALACGSAGAGGSQGPAGVAGSEGFGAWGLLAIKGIPVPIPIFPDNGSPGSPGSAGIFGAGGTLGALFGMRAHTSAILTVSNSILTSESATSSTGVTAISPATVTLNNTLLHGFQTPYGPGASGAGLGNLLADPEFVDVNGGDFHLSPGSPAIDAGGNASVHPSLVADLDGLNRIADGNMDNVAIVDMGVFEWQAVPPECPGDTNSDGLVNGADLSVLLAQFGASVAPGTGADFNGDALVNGADLSVLLSNFGGAC